MLIAVPDGSMIHKYYHLHVCNIYDNVIFFGKTHPTSNKMTHVCDSLDTTY